MTLQLVILIFGVFFIFFCKQKTAYEMRISDWSSDVCSSDLLAAIDLGSNTFRLSIGRVVQRAGNAQIYSVDRLRESVRVAEGLDDQKVLSQDAVDRAIAVLKRFGERLAGFPASSVRAVATNTFRVARNADDILPVLEAALGFPIEIISGQEEARLIFSGVSNELPPSESRRLVIDIGGGSTEFIIGYGYKPIHMASLYMGCTSYTKRDRKSVV